LGNTGIQQQKMCHHEDGIVICSSPHYLLICIQFKELLGDAVTQLLGSGQMQSDVPPVMCKNRQKTLLAEDLLRILLHIGLMIAPWLHWA
jgi:hypothetical protein